MPVSTTSDILRATSSLRRSRPQNPSTSHALSLKSSGAKVGLFFASTATCVSSLPRRFLDMPVFPIGSPAGPCYAFTVLSSLMTAEQVRLSRGAPLEKNLSIRALTLFMLRIKLYYFGRPVTWPLSNEQVCIFLCMCEACPTSRWADNNTHWAHAQKSRLDKHGGYGLTR